MTDHDAEMDAIVAMLEDAGLIEQHTDEEGRPALRLTARGAQVGQAMAVAGEAMAVAGDDADADAVLEALLDART